MSEKETKTILIIDDDPYIVQMIEMLLKLKGFNTITANNGIDAVQKIYKSNPDLVLLDVMMPKMNGYQVLRLIRGDSNLKHIPVIMLTAKVQEEDRLRGLLSGANFYLTKPFEMAALINKIEELVSNFKIENPVPLMRDIDIIEILSKSNDLLDKRIYELEIIGKIIETMTTTSDLDHILYEIASGVKTLLGFDRIWIALVNEEDNLLEGRVCLGHTADSDFIYTKTPIDPSSKQPAVKAILNKNHLNVTNIGRQLEISKEQLVGTKANAFLDVPIIIHEKALGVIRVDNFQSGEIITEDDIKQFTTFVNQAGLAIENAKTRNALIIEKFHFEQTISDIDSGIIVMDQHKNIIIYNSYLVNLFGISKELILNKSINNWINLIELEEDKFINALDDLMQQKVNNYQGLGKVKSKKDDSIIFLNLNSSLLQISDSEFRIVISIIDTTKEKESLKEIELKEEKYSILHQIGESINQKTEVNALMETITNRTFPLFFKKEDKLGEIEPDFCSVLLYNEAENALLITTCSERNRIDYYKRFVSIDPSTNCITAAAFREGKEKISNNVQMEYNYIGDEDIISEMSVPIKVNDKIVGVFDIQRRANIPYTDDNFELFTSIGNLISIAYTNASLLKQAQDLSVTDELTSIHNRRYLNDVLQKEFNRSRRYGRDLSLIMLDIDNFKNYNDTHGHFQGDEILKGVAKILLNASRSEIDCTARFGGEEFMLVLPETDKKDALKTAERIRQLIENHPFPYREQQPLGKITASIGVASIPNDANDLTTLLEKVDAALYFGKHNGRNLVVDAANIK